MIKRISGISNLQTPNKTANQVFTNGQSVKLVSGLVVPSAVTDTIMLGVSQQAVALTDGEYNKTTGLLVDLFDQNQVLEIDVTNGGSFPGTLAANQVGQYFKLDSSAANVDSSTATTTPITGGAIYVLIGYISPSKGLFKILLGAVV